MAAILSEDLASWLGKTDLLNPRDLLFCTLSTPLGPIPYSRLPIPTPYSLADLYPYPTPTTPIIRPQNPCSAR
jgi:hypothetical protein